jgi:hypothetical protein
MSRLIRYHFGDFHARVQCIDLSGPQGQCAQRIWSWDIDLCEDAAENATCAEWRERNARVERFARQHSDDPWVIGQGVFLMTRERRFDEAEELANACTAEPWWCAMLRGHVVYDRGDALAAEPILDSAVVLAPDPDGCPWTELEWVVDEDGVKPYDDEDCRQRWRRLTPVWLLADPAWTLPGNESRAAWLGRMAWNELHDDHQEESLDSVPGVVTDGVGHSRDHHREVMRGDTLMVRIGHAWKGSRGSGPTLGTMPHERALADPLSTRDEDWRFTGEQEDFRIDTEFGGLHPIPHQIAFFERGDATLVVGLTELPLAQFRGFGTVDSTAMVVATPEAGIVSTTWANAVGQGRPLLTTVPRGDYLVGIEAHGSSGLGRARVGHRLPSRPDAPLRASDLLLFRPAGRDPGLDDLEGILPRARGAPDWQVGDVVGVYLEVYGADDYATTRITVTVESLERSGFLRRLGEVTGLVEGDAPLRISWSETQGEGFAGVWTLELADLEPGTYRLSVTAAAPAGGEAAEVTVGREIRVWSR